MDIGVYYFLTLHVF